jgi:hypothetical protein
VVGVGVGDDGAVDRAPRVDEEIARRAVEAFAARDDQIALRSAHRTAIGEATSRPQAGGIAPEGGERSERPGVIQ